MSEFRFHRLFKFFLENDNFFLLPKSFSVIDIELKDLNNPYFTKCPIFVIQ